MIQERNSEKANEKIVTRSLGDSHPKLIAFNRVPRYPGPYFISQLIPIFAFCVLFVGFIPLVNRYPVLNHGWQGLVLFVPWFFLAAWCSLWVAKRCSLIHMQSQKDRDAKRIPAPNKDSVYVGISYTDGDWAYRSDTSWDRGWLTADSDELRFLGFGPQFSLPWSLIDNISVRQTSSLITNSLPRLYIVWHDPQGQRNTVNLEVRDAGTRTATIEKIGELAVLLKKRLAARSMDLVDSAQLPFRSSELEFSDLPEGVKVSSADRWTAVAYASGAGLGFMMLGMLLHRQLGVNGGAIAGVGGPTMVAVYNGTIISRLKAKRKAAKANQERG